MVKLLKLLTVVDILKDISGIASFEKWVIRSCRGVSNY
jgi:hypothetical protein